MDRECSRRCSGQADVDDGVVSSRSECRRHVEDQTVRSLAMQHPGQHHRIVGSPGDGRRSRFAVAVRFAGGVHSPEGKRNVERRPAVDETLRGDRHLGMQLVTLNSGIDQHVFERDGERRAWRRCVS